MYILKIINVDLLGGYLHFLLDRCIDNIDDSVMFHRRGRQGDVKRQIRTVEKLRRAERQLFDRWIAVLCRRHSDGIRNVFQQLHVFIFLRVPFLIHQLKQSIV